MERLTPRVQTYHHPQVSLNSQSQPFLQRFADELTANGVCLGHALDFIQTEKAGNFSRDDETIDHFYEFGLTEVVVLEEENGPLVLVRHFFENGLHLLLELPRSELPESGQAQKIELENEGGQLQTGLSAHARTAHHQNIGIVAAR